MLCLPFLSKPDHPHRLAEAARLPDEVGSAAGGSVPEGQNLVGIGGDFPIAPQRRGLPEAGILGQKFPAGQVMRLRPFFCAGIHAARSARNELADPFGQIFSQIFNHQTPRADDGTFHLFRSLQNLVYLLSVYFPHFTSK